MNDLSAAAHATAARAEAEWEAAQEEPVDEEPILDEPEHTWGWLDDDGNLHETSDEHAAYLAAGAVGLVVRYSPRGWVAHYNSQPITVRAGRLEEL